MKPEYEKLKADIDAFPEGPEKQAMRRGFDELMRSDEQSAELRRFHSKQLIARRFELVVCLLCVGALTFVLLKGLYYGRVTNFFLKDMPYAYRADEPYMFWFIVLFLLAVSLVLLLAAFRLPRIGGAR